MDIDPIPSIHTAIARGRGSRGRKDPEGWVRHRARLLTIASTGLVQGRIGGMLGLSTVHVGKLLAEACDAVLQGEAPSPEAERACATKWQRWCEMGDVAACARLRQGVRANPAPPLDVKTPSPSALGDSPLGSRGARGGARVGVRGARGGVRPG
jgi:hypothetical protein